MKSLKEKAPQDVVTMEQYEQYCILVDDITAAGVVLEFQDRHAVAELAISMVDARHLRADLAENGDWIETQGDRNQIKKKNPSRQALEKLQVHINRLMRDFKMTPNSRKQIGASTGGATGDELEGV